MNKALEFVLVELDPRKDHSRKDFDRAFANPNPLASAYSNIKESILPSFEERSYYFATSIIKPFRGAALGGIIGAGVSFALDFDISHGIADGVLIGYITDFTQYNVRGFYQLAKAGIKSLKRKQ